MRSFYPYIVLILLINTAFGQGKNVFDLLRGDRQVANEFYEQMDFRSAIHYFEKALDKRPDDTDSKFKMAQSYIELNETAQAEVWLRSIVSSPEADMKMNLVYADVLIRNGKLEQAIEWYSKILNYEYNEEVASKLHFLNNKSYYEKDSLYEIEILPINSEQSDFSYQPFRSGMIFISARPTDRYIQHQPSTASNEEEGMLRYFTYDTGNVNQLIYNEELKPFFHDGPLSFYNNEQKVAFTRNDQRDAKRSKSDKKVNLKIFFASCSDPINWTGTEPFAFNSEDYSAGHPALNSNGTVMFFSSDMPGGYGGADLYISYNYNGSWSQPENLGPKINTTGNELFPKVYNDTTLYFSSSGLGGFGGLDLFVSSFKNNRLSQPKNLGSPINSTDDDFSITLDETARNGFFSSNRKGGAGLDDIYSFRTLFFGGRGQVTSKQTGDVIEGASVIITSQSGQIWEVSTDSVGGFPIHVPYDAKYQVSVEKEGFSMIYEQSFSTEAYRIDQDTLRLSMWADELFAKGKLYSNETQELLENAVVVLENLDNGLKDSLITDATGIYEFVLTPNTKYRITAKHEGFIKEDFTINTTNIFRGDLLNDMVLEEVFVDKVITYFDFDESKIHRTDYDSLNELVRTLKRFPKSIVNIAAHADSRGTEAYNKRLSQSRLDELVKYFRSKGISRRRIKGVAFGEELIINKCSDGTECEEEDHRKNRRAELKVQTEAIH